MEYKLVIAIAALMVAALAAPAVIADPVAYSATVISGQSTSVTAINGTFGDVASPSVFADNEITDSITCVNTGNADATVSAAFTSSVVADTPPYGLVAGTAVIGGSNFQLGNTTFVQLTDGGSVVTLDGVPATLTVTYDAQLQVPSGQTGGSYAGTVELTFS